MFELKIITHFAAAHRLKMVADKCENLHGHNWKIEVYVGGETLNEAGVLVDFGEIKQHLSAIMERLDHKFLS
jgi:6-pyruvoyltetrahydropterin/6-carboxytetrahydropterin synthase